MAERTGLEPATSGVTGQHSNQLNYRSANLMINNNRSGSVQEYSKKPKSVSVRWKKVTGLYSNAENQQ